ncbi:GlxA family transcriptional regulator [Agromyces aerolatus]|uniref:GlxA family transcriptional regulator n=1 Tax=Agromyces sp. LY-1074 TaxID=3074080 RepID=UPI002861A1B3|nr:MULTISPECIES: helix-turn-helix domain-containing protein [unclassified Agromyces]MDR5700392.1 helix-turn-helix domain-containing protein [Agromyces sp. LY-1074]MDR5706630.1 helix-turn-helix domain-containing protein [Agromyces sp. LY-1358]
MLHTVACLALPHMAPFEFGVICEVFGIDRSEHGGPTFDFHVIAADPGPVRTKLGFDLVVTEGLEAAATADLIAVPASLIDEAADERVLQVIRDAVARNAWVLSVCSGAFTLARAGVLEGRRATTHWMYTDRMAEMYPGTEVDPDVLFVQDGKVVTGAGTAAGIDAALHVVRTELGQSAANIIARRMVVPPQRDGGQSQFIQTPVVEARSDSFAQITEWMVEHLDEELTVDRLARKALMSPRTFARKFRAETGTTPNAWLNRQRLLRAQQLLEETDLTLEEIARETGFGAAAVMRHHFLKVLQTTPTAYRRLFGAPGDAAVSAAAAERSVSAVG